jgi:hypothetical protein
VGLCGKQGSRRNYTTNIFVDNLEMDTTIEFSDPAPPAPDATTEEDAKQRTLLLEYSTEQREYHTNAKEKSVHLWYDLTVMFRPDNVRRLSQKELKAWRGLLDRRGIVMRRGRGVSLANALIEVITAVEYPGNADAEHEDAVPADEQQTSVRQPRRNPDGGGDSDDNGDDDDVPSAGRGPRGRKHTAANRGSDGVGASAATTVDLNGHALQSLQKLYIGRKKFDGEFDEDLVGALRVYDTISSISGCSEREKAAGLPIALGGDALQYFAEELSDCRDYAKATAKLHAKYSSDEQRCRLLQDWQTTRLSTMFAHSPEKSQIDVFTAMVRKLQKLQRQLAPDYHQDTFLRDQLVISADIPSITRSLRDKVASTSQKAQQRIAAMLSTEPGSAGTTSALFVGEENSEALYGIGRRFGGAAKRGPNFRRKGPRRDGCWVCKSQEHFARDKHTKQEIQTALSRMKETGAYVSAASVEGLFQQPEDESEDTDDGDAADAMFATEEAVEAARDAVQHMGNVAFLCGFGQRMQREMETVQKKDSRERDGKFHGLILDTGANRASMISRAQYRAYCREFGVTMQVRPDQTRRIAGIAGGVAVLGRALIPVAFPELGLVLDVNFKITEHGPSLLCLRDMKDANFQLDIQRNLLWHGKKAQHLRLDNDHLLHLWTPETACTTLYTEVEVRKLHRAFGHPSVEKLANLLKTARPDEVNADVRQAIDALSKECDVCSRTGTAPRRFKLTMGMDDVQFNHVVAVDVMFLDGKMVLHMVDEATHFQAASFLKNGSAEETWNVLSRSWSRMYLGPPDFLRIDQGTNFTAREFVDSAAGEGISVLEAPIECPTTMSHVERYHGPLRLAYTRIRADDPSMSQENSLQMAVKCVNDTVGPEGLTPTLLVFGSLPRPARRVPAETQIARARTIERVRGELRKEFARQKVAVGLKYKGPFGGERADLAALRPGDQVLVYRPPKKAWEEFKFVDLDGDTVTVQGNDGRKLFRSNVVKPLRRGESAVPDSETLAAMFGTDCDAESSCLSSEAESAWEESRKAELRGLHERDMFRIVPKAEMRPDERLYGTRFVDTIKRGGERKSRLVAQNYRDEGASDMPVRSPTVSRAAQRVCLSFAASLKGNQGYLRDVSMAYTQSTTKLERRVFLRPPKEMQLADDEVLHCLKPLYGIPESGLHWFCTYSAHHMTNLAMTQSRAERCLFYRREGDELSVTTLQVDDSWGTGTRKFLEDEERESRRFVTKPRTMMRPGSSVCYNGSIISQTSDGEFTLTQEEKLVALKQSKVDDQLVSTRAAMQYIATCTRPDIAAACQLQASKVGKGASTQTYKDVNSLVDVCHRTAKDGLKFVRLNLETLRVVVFCDASFANAENFKSQLGFCVLLVDDEQRANIVHYGSKRCTRVTRSVMAAELHGLLAGFDNSVLVAEMVSGMLGRRVNIEAMTDSKTVFDTVTRLSSTLEKRLQIDAYALQEAHQKGELTALYWIMSEENVADPLTKSPWKENSALRTLMRDNKLKVSPTGWCHRITRKNEHGV